MSIVALAISQEVMPPELQELLSDHTKWEALLKTASKGYYKFQACIKAQNAPVFLLRRISRHTGKEVPLKEQPTAKHKDINPHNCAAWGKHHRPLSSSNLNKASAIISTRLGLETQVISCVLCISFALKSIRGGAGIADWRVSNRMGYFRGDLRLARTTYASTFGPAQTTRAHGKETALVAIEENSLITHLPDPANLDLALLLEGKELVSHFFDVLEGITKDRRQHVPASLTTQIVNCCLWLNSRAQVGFKQSLLGLLSLTSSNATKLWSLLAQEDHLFD